MTDSEESRDDWVAAHWDRRLQAQGAAIAMGMYYEEPSAFADQLWHYTTAAGLFGVLSSGHLWVTDADYLNDAQEVRVLRQDLLRRACARHDQSPTLATKFAIETSFASQDAMTTAAVLSFSQSADDLSQWRSYGDDGWGFALVFDTRQLKDLLPKIPQAGLPNLIVGCDYDVERREQFADSMLDHIEKIFSLPADPADSREVEAGYFVSFLLNIAAPRFKDASFASESEVRLVMTNGSRVPGQEGSPGASYSIRQVGRRLVPYRSVPLVSAIKEIWLGPQNTSNAATVTYSVQELLESQGIIDVAVKRSASPYRP